ncbi:DUF305 domain-containing protein [Methylobacterium radiotolerans]|uniref:DUF305 domain-containing protein n=1 Tax=Methylobacterium radiotolerans TaxID=31998 RepID=UPI000E31409D|nr:MULTISPECIES: DUF305 domain-containing protein [Methylobacterium]MDE3749415.1 DUF305 domain-containing protein [Methylobacterium radiotolerans]
MIDYNESDIRFIQGMIPHHEMAVRMAHQEIASGRNPFAKSLALRIMTNQDAEIRAMRAWLAQRGLRESGGHSM